MTSACASGTHAWVDVARLLAAGEAVVVVAGGAEVPIHAYPTGALTTMGAMTRRVRDPGRACRPFDAERDRLVLSECGRFLVLRLADFSREGIAKSVGAITGAALTTDSHHMTGSGPDALGASRCMALAFGRAGRSPADVESVNAHGTATLLNEGAEAVALRTVADWLTPMTLIKGAIGHAMGAAGALASVVALQPACRGVPQIVNCTTVDPSIAVDVVICARRCVDPGHGDEVLGRIRGPESCLGDRVRGVGMSSAEAIQHFDVSTAFYRFWLDDTMTYRAALWPEAEPATLNAAQVAMPDCLIDGLRIPTGGRVLDIGGGWGSFLRHAEERVGGVLAASVTLSSSPASACSMLGLDVRLESWDEHAPDPDVYDAIAAIWSFEQAASAEMSSADRLEVYEHIFTRGAKLLAFRGRLGIQTIAHDGGARDMATDSGRSFSMEIFPESGLPELWEITRRSRPWFRVVSLRIDGSHYAHTCRKWRNRLIGRRAATAVADAETVRRHLKYLLLAALQFTPGHCTLCRAIFTRRV